MSDLPRIQDNVQKMIGLQAPEADIDGYLASEGLTPDQFKASVTAPKPSFMEELAHPNPTTNYGILWPVARDQGAPAKEWGRPSQLMQDVYRAVTAPGRALSGEMAPEQMNDEARNMAGTLMLGGGATTAVPKLAPEAGAMAMNAIGSRPVQATARAITSVAQPLLDRLDPDGAVGRTLAKRIAMQNPGVPFQDALKLSEDRLNALGPDSVLADLGDSTQRLARTMIQNPGETAPLAKDVLGKRQAGEGSRVVNSIQQNVSDSPFYDVDAANKASKTAAGPLYESAYDKFPNISSDGLQLLLKQEPLVQQGINKGVELQRIEASTARQPFDPSRYGVTDFNEAGDPIVGDVTPLRLWHAAREGLDSMLETYRDPMTGKLNLDKRGVAIQGLRGSLSDEVKGLAGGAEGDFSQADKIYSDASKLNQALYAGRAFARGDDEITAKLFSAYSPEQQDAYRAGVAREMIGMVRKTGATPQQMVNALKDEAGIRKKLQVILPTQNQFNQFASDIEREMTFRDTNKLRGGSPTFSLGAENADSNSEVMGHLASAGGSAMKGNGIGAVSSALKAAQSLLTRAQMPQPVRDRIGKLLISSDPADKAEAFRLMRESQNSGWRYAP